MIREVVHSNKVNQLNLRTLNERELDLFISSLYALKNKGVDEVVLEFSEFKKLAELSNRSTVRLLQSIDAMTDKLVTLNNKIILPGGVIRKFNFFRTIDIDPSNETVRLAVNEDFLYLINDMVGEYTKYSLTHFLQLKTVHSKLLFKQLKQFDNELPGRKFYKVLEKDFKKKMNLETKDRSNYSKMLKNITNELGEYFTELKLERLNSEQKKITRGQKTKYLKWIWKNEVGSMKVLGKTSKKESVKKVTVKEKLAEEHIRKVKKAKEKVGNINVDTKMVMRNAIIKDFQETKGKKFTEEDVEKMNLNLKRLGCTLVSYEKTVDGLILKM